MHVIIWMLNLLSIAGQAMTASSDDGLPMIGMTSSEDIYVATGFGFWGMNNGTTSAMIISDMIEGKKTHLKDIFDPLRFKTEL